MSASESGNDASRNTARSRGVRASAANTAGTGAVSPHTATAADPSSRTYPTVGTVWSRSNAVTAYRPTANGRPGSTWPSRRNGAHSSDRRTKSGTI